MGLEALEMFKEVQNPQPFNVHCTRYLPVEKFRGGTVHSLFQAVQKKMIYENLCMLTSR